jgi:Tfp pilus assembly protein PilF
MEKRAVAGVAHSNDTKHRIVRYPGQPLPEVAFEQPSADLPGLLWVNRPEGQPDARVPDVSQLEAYYTAARKDPSLWPLWFRKLNELSKTQPDDPTVLNSLGAVALAEKKDNAAAEEYFARALKQGSEDPTTFMNLATALANLGQAHRAEEVLARGVAAYPYNGLLTARLAQQYAMDGEVQQARKVVEKYRAVFPEDALLREVEKHLEGAANVDPLTPSGRSAPITAPR